MRNLYAAVLFCVSLLLAGCHWHADHQIPSIQFTTIPQAADGGKIRTVEIAGRVQGAETGEQVVLYAKADVWWVQPTVQQSLTAIQPDGSWSNRTHLGTDYAALLVSSGYKPAPLIRQLPQAGKGGVLAVVTSAGTAAKPGEKPLLTKTLHFSGYDWSVRTANSELGGKTHRFDPNNAWVDTNGLLHLKITRAADGWVCSEIRLPRSLGYGTYTYTVQNSGQFEPATLLDMFTWSEVSVEQNHREMDINLTRWGNLENKNAEFVVWPYYVASNVFRFRVPSGPMTYSLRWGPSIADFQATRGNGKTSGLTPVAVAEQKFVSGIPEPGDETVHISFCAFEYAKAPMQHEAEVVLEKFQYLP